MEKNNAAAAGGEERTMKKLQYNSPVILTFFLLSLGVLLLDWLTSGWTTLHAFCVYRSSLQIRCSMCGCSVMCWAMRTSTTSWAICCCFW